EVAAGLDHAHRLRDDAGAPLGLVHRDVTPRNILLSLAGEVKVTDFGVAALGDGAGEGRRGTVPYMSPEQARGEAVDARSDLFSVGLVLHELLTGERVRRGEGQEEILEQARGGQVPRAPGAPEALADIVERACAARPEDRFESAREMQRQLAAWVLAERGRSGAEPLEHVLAGFLGGLFPGWSERRGEDAGLRPAGTAGTATLRSVAETAADPGEAPRQPAGDMPPTPRRRPTRWLAPAAIALAAAATLAIATTRSGPSERPPAVQPSTA